MNSNKTEKNQISIKRYRPLWRVLAVDVDESWDDFKKVKAMLTGGDNATHIETCINENLLSVKMVLSRIQTYADEKTLNTDVDIVNSKFDSEKARYELLTSLCAISKKDDLLNNCGKEMEKLLLLMFELGTQVGAINIQDLAIRGKEDIKKKYLANNKSTEKRQPKADSRKKAYLNAFNKMKGDEYKLTYYGLRAFLKDQSYKKFITYK